MEIILPDILKSLSGNAEVTLSVDNSSLLEVHINGKEITIEVKDALKAMEMGLQSLIGGEKKKGEKGIRESLKAMGFRIKVKYSIFEIEV
ncbi:MAG: hypothetical protein HY367_03310 [Candidatus Aenigmarchaeota archaeon]|nr:hypothetical protein [Candidatus Aenigmarchaeota archaeon]